MSPSSVECWRMCPSAKARRTRDSDGARSERNVCPCAPSKQLTPTRGCHHERVGFVRDESNQPRGHSVGDDVGEDGAGDLLANGGPGPSSRGPVPAADCLRTEPPPRWFQRCGTRGWWRVGLYAEFCPGPLADQPKRGETAAEQRKRLHRLSLFCTVGLTTSSATRRRVLAARPADWGRTQSH